jgi:hypothetical protein
MRELGRDLTGPRSFQTSWIEERSRPSLRQRRVASSLDVEATDNHALHMP